MAHRKSRKRSRAAKKGWRTRRRNTRKRSFAVKKGWKQRRRRERKLKREARKKQRNVLDRERPAFLLREQKGKEIEAKIRESAAEKPTVRANVGFDYVDKDTGEFHQEVYEVEFEAPKPEDQESRDEFWRRFHNAIREELEAELDLLEDDDIDYEDLSVTIVTLLS